MKLILAAAALLVSSTSYASYLESCEFTATVTEITGVPTLNESVSSLAPIAKLQITAAKDQGSHVSQACDNRVGTGQLLLLKEGEALIQGQQLIIDYFYVNSLTPTGVAENVRWTVISSN